jgi:uncharacterized protein
MAVDTRPGSEGEHILQEQDGHRERADRFYRDQMLDRLSPLMRTFIEAQIRMFIATVDEKGRPDSSIRFGEPGFLRTLDESTIVWAELRGNGVLTTVGNILLNPHTTLLFADEVERIGLHVRGSAVLVAHSTMVRERPDLVAPWAAPRPPERWVRLTVDAAYVHCRKHFPIDGNPVEAAVRGTDDPALKGGDPFGARQVQTPWSSDQPAQPVPTPAAATRPATTAATAAAPAAPTIACTAELMRRMRRIRSSGSAA